MKNFTIICAIFFFLFYSKQQNAMFFFDSCVCLCVAFGTFRNFFLFKKSVETHFVINKFFFVLLSFGQEEATTDAYWVGQSKIVFGLVGLQCFVQSCRTSSKNSFHFSKSLTYALKYALRCSSRKEWGNH